MLPMQNPRQHEPNKSADAPKKIPMRRIRTGLPVPTSPQFHVEFHLSRLAWPTYHTHTSLTCPSLSPKFLSPSYFLPLLHGLTMVAQIILVPHLPLVRRCRW